MKTKLFTGLALAAALLIGGPAFGHDNRGGGGGGGRSVAAFHGGGGHSIAAFRGGGGRGGNVAGFSGGGMRAFRGGRTFASGRTFTGSFARGTNVGRSSRSPSIAFGGSTYNSRAYSGGRGNSTFAFRSHNGWSHDREYFWHGHHYRWFNNGWFLIDPYPYYDYYGYGGPAYTVYGNDYANDSDSVGVEVQQALSQDGYYQGPIDGIVGPGTRAAIAAYQRDNGLRVTGGINGSLLDSMRLE